MENKKLRGEFIWIPRHKRKDRFGLPLPPGKRDHRLPLLWIAVRKLQRKPDSELYLVNSSGERLDFVETRSYGFAINEDDIISVTTEKLRYDNVQPGIAVKVDQYDIYYDPEFILGIVIRIKSEKLGILEIRPPMKKGGLDEMVLLWDSMEAGKSVKIKRCSEDD